MERIIKNVITRSQQTKNIEITGFTKYDENDLFYYDEGSKVGKFSISCKTDKYDSNINILNRQSKDILKEIDNNNNIDVITINTILKQTIIKPIVNNLTCYFSGDELVKEKDFYKNKYTAINMFDIDYRNVTLQYNRKNDVFQLVIEEFTIYSKELDYAVSNIDTPITVNVTHPGASLSKIKNNK